MFGAFAFGQPYFGQASPAVAVAFVLGGRRYEGGQNRRFTAPADGTAWSSEGARRWTESDGTRWSEDEGRTFSS